MLPATSSHATFSSQASQGPSQCPWRASVLSTAGVHTASQPYANAYASAPSIRMTSHGQHSSAHGTTTCLSDASIASMVVVPYCGPTTVVSTTGDAYCALQPSSVQYALVLTSQLAPKHAPTASIASQVVDPYCGRTKVVATTGGAYCALQPDPGHVNHMGQASVPPATVPIPPSLQQLV
jgi:hypothetical protein